MLINDLIQFNFVNGAGFMRFCEAMNSKWDIGSASYYNKLVDKYYDKVKSKLKAMIQEESPDDITIFTHFSTSIV